MVIFKVECSRSISFFPSFCAQFTRLPSIHLKLCPVICCCHSPACDCDIGIQPHKHVSDTSTPPPLKSHSSFKNMFWLIQTFISAVEQKYASPWPPPNAAAAIDRLLFEWAGHNLDTFAWAAEEETAKNRCYYKAKLCFLSHVRYTSCLKASTGKTSCLTLCAQNELLQIKFDV